MPTPSPASLRPRICSRYLDNGTRCTNPTAHADGWCRAHGCPGYTRPLPDREAGPRKWHSFEVTPAPCPLDAYDVATLEVSRNAVGKFRETHGTTKTEAEAQIRTLAEDLALQGRWRTNNSGWVYLAHLGFFVAISPDLTTVTDYRTTHQERTYAQVKAGVPSRYRRERAARQRARRAQRRHDALIAAGLTCSYDTERGTVTVTDPDGRSVDVPGRNVRDMSAVQWRGLGERVRARLGVDIAAASPGGKRPGEDSTAPEKSPLLRAPMRPGP